MSGVKRRLDKEGRGGVPSSRGKSKNINRLDLQCLNLDKENNYSTVSDSSEVKRKEPS